MFRAIHDLQYVYTYFRNGKFNFRKSFQFHITNYLFENGFIVIFTTCE